MSDLVRRRLHHVIQMQLEKPEETGITWKLKLTIQSTSFGCTIHHIGVLTVWMIYMAKRCILRMETLILLNVVSLLYAQVVTIFSWCLPINAFMRNNALAWPFPSEWLIVGYPGVLFVMLVMLGACLLGDIQMEILSVMWGATVVARCLTSLSFMVISRTIVWVQCCDYY